MSADLKERASAILIERKGLLGEYADQENKYVMQLIDIIKELTEREAKLLQCVRFYASDYGVVGEAIAEAILKELGIDG